MPIRPAFQYHGGKWFLKHWIISQFPPNYESFTYIEPFIGAGNVLLNKKESVGEIAVDLNFNIHCLWLYIKNDCDRAIRYFSNLKYSQQTFDKWKNDSPFSLKGKAVKEFVLRRMSRGGLGKTFSWQTRLRGGKPGSLNAWETSIDNLRIVSNRIQNVQFFNGNAIKYLQDYDNPNLLAYLDPPYLSETRQAKTAYQFEMSDKEHTELLWTISQMKGKVIISGYNSDLYNRLLNHWNKLEKQVKNHSGQNRTKQDRTEVLWKNY